MPRSASCSCQRRRTASDTSRAVEMIQRLALDRVQELDPENAFGGDQADSVGGALDPAVALLIAADVDDRGGLLGEKPVGVEVEDRGEPCRALVGEFDLNRHGVAVDMDDEVGAVPRALEVVLLVPVQLA